MARIPPKSPLDKPLEEAVADAIASDLIDGNVHVLDRRDLARRAAREGIRQAIDLAAQTLREMAADHEHAGEFDRAAALREGAKQIRGLPKDLPEGTAMPEKPTRVGDLIKAKEVSRGDVEAAIATVLDGKSTLPSEGEVMR